MLTSILAIGKGPAIWNEYEAWFQESTGIFQVEGMRFRVGSVRWLSDDAVELSLQGQTTRIYAAPLRPVEEAFRNDEVCEGDIAVLAGQFIIIAEQEVAEDPESEYIMTNYLRATSIEEDTRSRRGANRAKKLDTRVTCQFR